MADADYLVETTVNDITDDPDVELVSDQPLGLAPEARTGGITAAALLAEAAREIGYREGSNNRNKYATETGLAQYQPWCAIFVTAMGRRVGAVPDLIPRFQYTPLGAQWFAERQQYGSVPRVGSVLFVHRVSLGRVAHTGFVRAVEGDHILTIEGNTAVGGSREGVGVFGLRRRISGVLTFGHPAYVGAGSFTAASTDRMDPAAYFLGAVGEHVLWLGNRLVALGFATHYTRGPGPRFGEADRRNVADFQRAQGWHGVDADGFPGPQTLERIARES
jgi:hypothetical protein